MSELLSLFPLPTVVLFPNVFLPLHVFEPRYREMIADALASDRVIGMALLRQGWEQDYEGRPPMYSVGCSGVITHVERLPEGRYTIVLRGVERFRIGQEDDGRSYRRAVVTPMPERPASDDDRLALRHLRARLESLVVPSGGDVRIAAGMADEEIVNALAQYLELDAIEKQALLEHDSTRERAKALVDLLEMKILLTRVSGGHTRLTH
jgi:Lon protease-like protein